MTKAAICGRCADIVSPYRNWEKDRRWRWCECGAVATRWRDGRLGHLEVTSTWGPDHVRVLGLNNSFLFEGLRETVEHARTDTWWKELHQRSAEEVAPNYIFHKDRRDCWALLIRVGESGDVFYIPYQEFSTGKGFHG